MRALGTVFVLALVFGEVCVVVDECNPRKCNGCCNTSGQCEAGAATNACGNGGNACAVCPATFTCSLGSCQPGGSSGGGSGTGGGGGGLGGGIGGGGGGVQAGDVTFLWNFAGQSCAQLPELASVRVTIPGQTLQNGGVFACNNGTDGIRLLNFQRASYDYTVEGLSAGGTALYLATGNFFVNGNVTVNVTLLPTSAPASALVSWTFPPNGASATPNCTQAGVLDVTVSVSGGPPLGLVCSTGFGSGARLDNLSAGTQSVLLEALDANGFVFYRKGSTITAQLGALVSNAYTFEWAVGSLPVKWTFSNGTTQLDCAQAGVSQMNINLRDAQQNLLYGSTGVDVPCRQGAFQGTDFPYLSGGQYALFLQAYGTGNVLYRTNFTSPPMVTVVEGQFPLLDAATPANLLTP